MPSHIQMIVKLGNNYLEWYCCFNYYSTHFVTTSLAKKP